MRLRLVKTDNSAMGKIGVNDLLDLSEILNDNILVSGKCVLHLT